MKLLKPYYYFGYAVRRLLGADAKRKDFTEWRAIALMLLVQIQLVIAVLHAFFRSLDDNRSAGWGIAIGILVVAVTYLTIGNRRRFLQYAKCFDSWSKRKRAIADVATGVISIISLFSLVLVKEFLG